MEWKRPTPIAEYRGSARAIGAGTGRATVRSAVPACGFRWAAGGRGGGLSIGTIIFLVVIYFVFRAMGIDLLQVLDGGRRRPVRLRADGRRARRDRPQAGRDDRLRPHRARRDRGHLERHLPGDGETYRRADAGALSGAGQLCLRLRVVGDRPVLLPRRPARSISTSSFFEELRDQFGASGDFAAGLCARPRGRPSCAEPDRRAAEVQPDAPVDERDGGQRDVGSRRAAGRLLCRHLGQLHRRRRACSKPATSRRR